MYCGTAAALSFVENSDIRRSKPNITPTVYVSLSLHYMRKEWVCCLVSRSSYSFSDSLFWVRHCARWLNWIKLKNQADKHLILIYTYTHWFLAGSVTWFLIISPSMRLPRETQLYASQVTDVSIKVTHGKKYDHASRLIKTFSINEP